MLTLSAAAGRDLQSLLRRFRDVLTTSAADRDAHRQLVPDHGESVPAWVVQERAHLTEAVNRELAARGAGPVTEDEMHRLERRAVGHIDYATKFALYCAELVVDRTHRNQG